jgi:hypothetical protein
MAQALRLRIELWAIGMAFPIEIFDPLDRTAAVRPRICHNAAHAP